MCVVQSHDGCIHPQKHHTPEEMVCHNPMADHGGIRSRVYIFTRHSVSNKVTRLKKYYGHGERTYPMKACLTGMCGGCLRVVKNKNKNRLGAFIHKSTTRPRNWSVIIPWQIMEGSDQGFVLPDILCQTKWFA
jgi:hypothetical protein